MCDKSFDWRSEVIRYHIKFFQDALAVWNGRRVITYEYSADKSSIKAAGKLIGVGEGDFLEVEWEQKVISFIRLRYVTTRKSIQ